ncbi:AI-2E family transporter [Hydrogenovibrio sp. JE_KL2]|uniref:AI-2E family transporter n=1 Tax=Hydrogenovibrio sp. JE_KL2 TaxID=2651188 RepID=UPI00128B7583|nr:AI-2E family transporter [Hydrogenovibrio sp. JE_KL2]MPQ76692.1 AI-2E family transporter [Hydrogenovibrio sp. JE_KL2]
MRSQQSLAESFLFILLIVAIVGLLWLFSPFLEALFFAMILATATYAIYQKLLLKVNSETTASALMSVGVFLTVIAPVTYLLLEVGLQVGQVYGEAQHWLSMQTPQTFAEMNRNLVNIIPIPEDTQAQLIQQLHDNAGKIIKFAQETIVFLVRGVFGSTTSFLTFVLLAVFAMFFFYRDGHKIAQHLKVLSPLENHYDMMIMSRFSNLSTILLLSVLGVALVQGVTFATVAWLLGLPGLFLGMAIAVTSFIPVVGSALIWIPVASFLVFQGQYVEAGAVVFIGAVINGFLIDNVLRPILIRRISMTLHASGEGLEVANHTMMTILSTFAGLIHFGIIGLFFGPVIAALAITIFDVYALKHSDLLDRT